MAAGVGAEALSPQAANNMVAEVCSVYVARADNTLELYATEGLNREAVLALLKPVLRRILEG